MLRTLRRRLILSHVLPLMVILPLIGLALVYILESQVVLPDLAVEVNDQAKLTAELAQMQPAIWTDSKQAQDFVEAIDHRISERVMLLDAQGRLRASSDAADAGRLQTVIDIPDLASVLAGKPSVRTTYSQRMRTDVVDVLVPLLGKDQQVVGVVRLSHSLANVYERFLRQRLFISAVLALGLLLGGAVGWLLALDIDRPLSQVTQAVAALAGGRQVQPVEEQGPDEVRLLARSFNSLVQRLSSLEQARRQLVANLVHELGPPLGALRSAIQALQGGADEDAALRRDLLVGMDDEVGRLRRLLDDLARLRDELVGTLELSRRPVILSEWLPPVLATWREAAQQKGLQWQLTLPDNMPALSIDPDRMAQVLGNLLSNAVKYTPSGGTVSVAGKAGDAIWIRVSDTGPGIAPDEYDRIFDPLYRGRAGRRFPQGMGLGLGIARSLVVAHGGRLELQSIPGRGSDFTVRIPLS